MSSAPGISTMASRLPLVSRFVRWLDAMPHPALAFEVACGHVAAARWARGRAALESYAIEPLPAGALVASPVEPNVVAPEAVRAALERVVSRLQAAGQETALLVPDAVVRVFILHFDTFPKRAEDAIPLLRWRLKKSLPFDVEDTVVSCMLQAARAEGIDVVAAVARQRIVREYEALAEAAGLIPGVLLNSTLATLPVLDDSRPTLLARLAGTSLTTVVVRGDLLAVYRCTEMPASAEAIEPQALLDEIYPAVAFYQDNWQDRVQQIRLAGLAGRYEEFRRALESGLGCSIVPLGSSATEGRLTGDARALIDRRLDALVGWMLNRGA